MQSLRRTIINSVTVLSLLLCAAWGALWIVSYWNSDAVLIFKDSSCSGAFRLVGVGGTWKDGIVGVGIWTERDPYRSPAELDALRNELLPSLPGSTSWAGYIGLHVRAGGRDERILRDRRWWTVSAFGTESHRKGGSWDREFVFPCWCGFFLFSLLPAVRFRRWRRIRRNLAQGHCARCGYDLRATPDRCPECGTVPSARG